MLKRLTATLVVVGALAAGLVTGAAPAAAANDGTVYVVHGIPGATVDVYVNGKNTLPDFKPGTVAGPLTLPAADYQVKIFKAGDDPSTATAVIDQSVTLPAGANVSLVAGLSADAKPTLFTFVNDTKSAAAGQGRVVVRHTAAAPAVDVLANGSPAFTNLANGKEAMTDLAAGTVKASVVAAGTTSPVLIGPADVPVTAGMATVVYAIGAPASGSNASTLGVVTQQIALAGSSMSVQSGTSGLLDRDGGTPAWAFVGLALAGVGLVGSGVLARRARRRAEVHV